MPEPLELARRLFGPDPPWPTPLVGPHPDRPAPVDPDPGVLVHAWGAMRCWARLANPKEPRCR